MHVNTIKQAISGIASLTAHCLTKFQARAWLTVLAHVVEPDAIGPDLVIVSAPPDIFILGICLCKMYL